MTGGGCPASGPTNFAPSAEQVVAGRRLASCGSYQDNVTTGGRRSFIA